MTAVGTLHTLCMCYFALWNKFQRSKKSISSYQRLNKAPTKAALARLCWSFRSKCASPCGLLTHRQERQGRACPPAHRSLFSLAAPRGSLTGSRDNWRQLRVSGFSLVNVVSVGSPSPNGLIHGLACIVSLLCPTSTRTGKTRAV